MSGTIQTPPTSTMTVTSGATGVFPVSYGYYPVEGSRGVTAQYTWASVTGYNEDLSVLSAMGVETTPQAAYVDNSTVTTAVTLTVKGTGQVVTVPAGSQGVFPLFFTATPGLFISTTGTGSGVTRVTYLNVPTNAAGVWSTTGSGGSYNGPPAANQGGTTAGTQGGLGLVAVNSANPSYTDAQMEPLSMSNSGSLRVALQSLGGTSLTAGFSSATAATAVGLGVAGVFNSAFPSLTTGQATGLQLTASGMLATALYTNTGTALYTGGATNAGVMIAGTYRASIGELASGTPNGLVLNAYNSVLVDTESVTPTYSATAIFTPAASPTDIFTLIGSGTKTVRVHQISVSFSSTGGATIGASIILRFLSNSGGTTSAVSAIPHDTSAASATATAVSYTANATGLGTATGTVETFFIGAPNGSGQPQIFDYGAAKGDLSLVLRGTSQSLAINLEGATMPAGFAARIKVKWSEV